jgi:hypothetical protein
MLIIFVIIVKSFYIFWEMQSTDSAHLVHAKYLTYQKANIDVDIIESTGSAESIYILSSLQNSQVICTTTTYDILGRYRCFILVLLHIHN